MDTADTPQMATGDGPALGVPAPPGPFPVSEVNGHRPRGPDDFLGVTSFTAISGDLSYRMFGTGETGSGQVRFRQQDLGRHGRDIRTWTITATGTGILAEPEPAAENRNPGLGYRPQGERCS